MIGHLAPGSMLMADKGYDADALVASIQASGAQAHILPRSNRNNPRSYDPHRYKARHVIENLFARLKQYRRVANLDILHCLYLCHLRRWVT